MRVPSHPDADLELEEAAFFYEKRAEGLGDDLLDDVDAAIERIVAHPTLYRVVCGQARQMRLRRFPYNLVYEVHGEDIFILALAHIRRRPFYWRHRH